MKRLTFIAILLMTAVAGQAQNDEAYIDTTISEFTSTMPAEASATMFSVKRYCNGSVKMFMLGDGNRCVSNGDYIEAYLFYKNGDSVWIKKFDNCGSYSPVLLEDQAAFTIFESNSSVLAKEGVKPYKTAQENTQPLARTVVHRCHRSYTFYQNSEVDTVKFKLYDLSNDSLQANMNYEYNNNLQTVKLDKMLDAVISSAEENNTFKRS